MKFLNYLIMELSYLKSFANEWLVFVKTVQWETEFSKVGKELFPIFDLWIIHSGFTNLNCSLKCLDPICESLLHILNLPQMLQRSQ